MGTASADGKQSISFLHIGKTGGTQIEKIIGRINELDGPVRILKHSHDVILRNIPFDQPYFFGIRDPASRFKSGFYSRKRMGRPAYDVPWSRYEANAFAEFEHANDLAEALTAPGDLGRRAFAAIKSIKHTGMDQVDWFVHCGEIFEVRPPLAIIRQENFDDDLATVLAAIGVAAEDVVDREPGRAHRNSYEGIPPLSELALRNLRAWYHQDYEFYRHCVSWIEQR